MADVGFCPIWASLAAFKMNSFWKGGFSLPVVTFCALCAFRLYAEFYEASDVCLEFLRPDPSNIYLNSVLKLAMNVLLLGDTNWFILC